MSYDDEPLLKPKISREEAIFTLSELARKGEQINGRTISNRYQLDKAAESFEVWLANLSDAFGKLYFEPAYPRSLFPDSPRVEELDGRFIDRIQAFGSFMQVCLEKLTNLIKELEIDDNLVDDVQLGVEISATEANRGDMQKSVNNPQKINNKVFIVHGRDDAARQSVARYVERFGFEAFILDERPNMGRTIIEKFEGESSGTGFAIVLMTPDDIGGLKEKNDSTNDRARQNVIFELGYFVGRLGRGKVCLLRKGDIEMPSDFDGVVYISMTSDDGWKVSLAREMKAAGLNVDLNKAM